MSTTPKFKGCSDKPLFDDSSDEDSLNWARFAAPRMAQVTKAGRLKEWCVTWGLEEGTTVSAAVVGCENDGFESNMDCLSAIAESRRICKKRKSFLEEDMFSEIASKDAIKRHIEKFSDTFPIGVGFTLDRSQSGVVKTIVIVLSGIDRRVIRFDRAWLDETIKRKPSLLKRGLSVGFRLGRLCLNTWTVATAVVVTSGLYLQQSDRFSSRQQHQAVLDISPTFLPDVLSPPAEVPFFTPDIGAGIVAGPSSVELSVQEREGVAADTEDEIHGMDRSIDLPMWASSAENFNVTLNAEFGSIKKGLPNATTFITNVAGEFECLHGLRDLVKASGDHLNEAEVNKTSIKGVILTDSLGLDMTALNASMTTIEKTKASIEEFIGSTSTVLREWSARNATVDLASTALGKHSHHLALIVGVTADASLDDFGKAANSTMQCQFDVDSLGQISGDLERIQKEAGGQIASVRRAIEPKLINETKDGLEACASKRVEGNLNQTVLRGNTLLSKVDIAKASVETRRNDLLKRAGLARRKSEMVREMGRARGRVDQVMKEVKPWSKTSIQAVSTAKRTYENLHREAVDLNRQLTEAKVGNDDLLGEIASKPSTYEVDEIKLEEERVQSLLDRERITIFLKMISLSRGATKQDWKRALDRPLIPDGTVDWDPAVKYDMVSVSSLWTARQAEDAIAEAVTLICTPATADEIQAEIQTKVGPIDAEGVSDFLKKDDNFRALVKADKYWSDVLAKTASKWFSDSLTWYERILLASAPFMVESLMY